MRARLLLNPTAGRGRGALRRQGLERLARAAGIGVEVSTSAGDLVERARRARADGVDRLLVGGGDGTMHWVVQGLAGGDTALAPVPLGTGNDLARSLGYRLDTESAFRAALEGPVTRIDLGRIGDRLFCVVAGIGFDAAVSDYARTRVKRLRGPAVYIWATLASLPSYVAPRLELSGDCGEFGGEIFFVAFANGSHYGGGMRIAPAADPADGQLDIVVVRRVAKLRLLAMFPRVYRGTHISHPAIEIRRATRLEVRLDPAQPINADGESLGQTRPGLLEVSILPAALATVRGSQLH